MRQLVVVLLILFSFLIFSGCAIPPEVQAELNSYRADVEEISKAIIEIRELEKKGEISKGEAAFALVELYKKSDETQEKFDKLMNKYGMKWYEILGYSLLSIITILAGEGYIKNLKLKRGIELVAGAVEAIGKAPPDSGVDAIKLVKELVARAKNGDVDKIVKTKVNPK